MRALPLGFTVIADARRAQGRRHRLAVVLAITAGAILCGMRGNKALSDLPGGTRSVTCAKVRACLIC